MTLHFKDATTATADVIIGADGVHSTAREFLIGTEAAKPMFSGAAIYRGLVPMNKAIEVLGSEHAQNAVTLCGPSKLLSISELMQGNNETGKAAITYPFNFGKTLNVAAFTFGRKEWPHEKWIVPA